MKEVYIDNRTKERVVIEGHPSERGDKYLGEVYEYDKDGVLIGVDFVDSENILRAKRDEVLARVAEELTKK